MLRSPHQFRLLKHHHFRMNEVVLAYYVTQEIHYKLDLPDQNESHGMDKKIRLSILCQTVLVEV